MEDPMLTADRQKICNELMGLYKAQLPLVEPTAMNTVRGWTIADLELYDQRSERIANLQRQLVEIAYRERCRAQGQPDSTCRELGRPLIGKRYGAQISQKHPKTLDRMAPSELSFRDL
jgi:hypothetical protein